MKSKEQTIGFGSNAVCVNAPGNHRVTFGSRSLGVIATVAILCELSVSPVLAQALFYTTSGAGTGLANGAELFSISITGIVLNATDIGPTNGGDCASLALAPWGKLYSLCGPLFGSQQLATIDPKTGAATLFGVPVAGLSVMALAFAPNGTLYAIGDCNPAPMTFECTPGADPTYNSLYTVDVTTGAFTRVGSTGAPQFFMDLAFDHNGNLFGVTTTLNPSVAPAILYRIDPLTGTATRIVNLVGSNFIMGLAFGLDGQLYATDYETNPGLYVIDIKTGFETAIAALPFSFSSGLELANPPGGGGPTSAITAAVAKPKNALVTQKEIQLDGTASTSFDGKPLTYLWTLAPGSLSAGIVGGDTATPTVQFSTGGAYTFVLTVTDSAGKTATDTATVTYYGH